MSAPNVLPLRGAKATNDQNEMRVSFEFFPPKNEKMRTTLWESIKKLEPLGPSFVSVTYGAGGSTRTRTHETVAKIAADTSLKPAAHLTCIGASKDEIKQVADEYWTAGVCHIVALRGDPDAGIGAHYTPTLDGYAYASDLVAGLKSHHDFEISVGAYPERHPESPSWQSEIDNLKRKVDAGADRAITQFFFTADVYWRFLEKVRAAGIEIPIVPGLMLQPNFNGVKRMSTMCGVAVPDWYARLFDGLENEPDVRNLLVASTTAELASELKQDGIEDFHLYTLNKTDLAFAVCKTLGLNTNKKASS